MRDYKLVVLGSTGVGKSAITIRFVEGNFVEKYDPTIEDAYTKNFEVDGEACTVEILDTAGMEMFAAMRELYMKNGQGFILVYSITSEQSFNELVDLRDKIVQVKGTEKVPLVLVANKYDVQSTEGVVSPEKGKSVATSWHCPIIEASAKSNLNINQIFSEIIRLIREKERENQKPKKSSFITSKQKQKKKTTGCEDCVVL